MAPSSSLSLGAGTFVRPGEQHLSRPDHDNGWHLTPLTTGYTYTLTGTATTSSATATPVVPRVTGDRSFFVDETGVIRWEPGPGANASSPEL